MGIFRTQSDWQMKRNSVQTCDTELFPRNNGVDAEIIEITRLKRNGLFGVKMSYSWQTLNLGLEGTQGLADMSCELLLAADFVCSWAFNSTSTC